MRDDNPKQTTDRTGGRTIARLTVGHSSAEMYIHLDEAVIILTPP